MKKEIRIDELEVLFQKIVQKLKEEGHYKTTLPFDLYRQVPTEKWGSFDDIELETGSLFDDLKSLKVLIDSKDRPCTYVDFDRVASILRAISEVNNPV